MIATLIFFAVIGAIFAWWLSHQRLTSKPWLEEGWVGNVPGTGAVRLPPAKIGLGFFLAVVGALFALAASAYFIRMESADWRPLPVPGLLWINTGILILNSVVLHWALTAARRGQVETMKLGLLAGGLSGVAFVVGQLTAWRELADAGFFLAGNPANSFFYLLTGLHGLHVLGGLIGLGWTAAKVWGRRPDGRACLYVELTALYWHFMLLVWLVVFALLMGWVNDFVDFCRQLLS